MESLLDDAELLAIVYQALVAAQKLGYRDSGASVIAALRRYWLGEEQ